MLAGWQHQTVVSFSCLGCGDQSSGCVQACVNIDMWFIIPAACSGCAVSAAEYCECLSESFILMNILLDRLDRPTFVDLVMMGPGIHCPKSKE